MADEFRGYGAGRYGRWRYGRDQYVRDLSMQISWPCAQTFAAPYHARGLAFTDTWPSGDVYSVGGRLQLTSLDVWPARQDAMLTGVYGLTLAPAWVTREQFRSPAATMQPRSRVDRWDFDQSQSVQRLLWAHTRDAWRFSDVMKSLRLVWTPGYAEQTKWADVAAPGGGWDVEFPSAPVWKTRS